LVHHGLKASATGVKVKLGATVFVTRARSIDMDLAARIRRALRRAGQTAAESRRAYREGYRVASLPHDEEGRARIVCRRHAERRAVLVSEDGRPACFEAGHPDCQGCVEDVREGAVETW
jgi:hypothetical protein